MQLTRETCSYEVLPNLPGALGKLMAADPTPLSAPSWATLLTGLKVEQHRITSNDLATRKQQKDGNQ